VGVRESALGSHLSIVRDDDAGRGDSCRSIKASLTYVSFTVGALWLQPFLLQQWASGLSWDYPSWSIGTEAEAYIFFVFAAGPLLTGKHPRLIAACCVTILAAVSIAGGGSLNLFNGVSALLLTLSEFSLGVLLYRAHLDATVFPRKWAAMLFVLFVGLWATSRLDFFVVVGFGGLLYHAAGTKDTYGRLLNSRPLVTLGNWSYSVYLWHAPTHYAVMASFAAIGLPVNHLGLLSSRLLLLVTGLAVVSLSAFNYQYFEIPVRRLVLYSRPVGFIRWQRAVMLSLTSNRRGKQNSLRVLTALTWPGHSAVVRCERVDAKLRLQPRQIPHAEFFPAAIFARILTAIDTLLTIVWLCVAHSRALCR
jgi:peptidoglycan/LPS O-acetylase OafA/YrhL